MNSEKKPKKISNLLYDFVKITGAIPALLWIRPKVIFEGEKKDYKLKDVLICSNHRSPYDPIILHCVFWNRRLHCLATKELFKTKFSNFFFTRMHCIKVDRQNFSMESFHEVTKRLNEGKALLIFPEGTVNHDNNKTMLTVKSGAILMAFQSKSPIIPVYIMPLKKWYNRKVVIVGKPLYIHKLFEKRPSISQINEVSKILMDKEIELFNLYKMRGGK